MKVTRSPKESAFPVLRSTLLTACETVRSGRVKTQVESGQSRWGKKPPLHATFLWRITRSVMGIIGSVIETLPPKAEDIN
jgi:hypothetical protein